MGVNWKDQGYELVVTADGSPSLRSLRISTLESMHHSGGALSETELIYTPVVRQVLQLDPGGRFFSLGLGLGYNELIWAREILSQGSQKQEGAGESSLLTVESEPFLSQTFLKQLQNLGSSEYQDLFHRIGSSENRRSLASWSERQLSQFLQKSWQTGSWTLSGALDRDWVQSYQGPLFQGIFYDAFSAKTCPDLWSEDFLNLFLQKIAAEDCVFSTYASRGVLRRTLLQHGFRVFLRRGFQGKRQSTYAIRGRFQEADFLTDVEKLIVPNAV